MARIAVDPTVQSATGFPVWAKGRYTLRISDVQQSLSKTGKSMLVLTLTPTAEVVDEQGTTLTSPGKLWDRVMIEPITGKNGNSVSFLRPLIEAAGLTWADFDTDQLVDREIEAQVGIETYEGRDRNIIVRYISGK